MGGLVSYFSKSWRGSESESSQDLVSAAQSKHLAETSLTNPDFLSGTDNNRQASSSPAHKPAELQSLPPECPNKESASKRDGNDEVDGESEDEDEEEFFLERPVNVTPLEDGDRYREINNIVNAIVHIYKPLVARKTGIKNAIKDFKTNLGVKQRCTLSQCFGVVRGLVHNDTRVELVCAGTEPLKLTVEEHPNRPLPGSLKQSVMFLNSALALCQKYKGEKELRLADIQYKLEDLHLMPLTRSGQDLYNSVNSIPNHLEELSTDIDRFHQQLYEARMLLRPK